MITIQFTGLTRLSSTGKTDKDIKVEAYESEEYGIRFYTATEEIFVPWHQVSSIICPKHKNSY